MKEKIKDSVVVSFVSRYTLSRRPEMLKDIKEILFLNNDFFIPPLHERIDFEGTLEEKINYRINERLNKYHYIIARLKGKVIGFTEVCFDDSYIYNKPHYCACVGTSAVHVDYQGLGIGRMLYKKLDEIAVEFEVEAVVRSTWTMNTKQLKLYAEFGYEEVERNEHFRGQGNHLVKYCKWFMPH